MVSSDGIPAPTHGVYPSPQATALSQRFSWIGCTGCVFFRTRLIVLSLRTAHRPTLRSRFVLRKKSPLLLPTASSHAARLSDSRVIAASFERRGLPTGWN